MIEIYNLARTKSYGYFDSFKSGKVALEQLRDKGELTASSVLVCQYRREVPVGQFMAMDRHGWRKVKNSQKSFAGNEPITQILKQNNMKHNLLQKYFRSKSKCDKAIKSLGMKRPNSTSVPARHKILMQAPYSKLKALCNA